MRGSKSGVQKAGSETPRGIAYLQIPGQSAPPLVGSQVSLGSSTQVLPSGHCAAVMPPQAWRRFFLLVASHRGRAQGNRVAILNGIAVTSLWGYVPHVLTRPPGLHRPDWPRRHVKGKPVGTPWRPRGSDEGVGEPSGGRVERHERLGLAPCQGPAGLLTGSFRFPDAGGTGDTGCTGVGPMRARSSVVHGLDGIAFLHRRGRRGFLGLGLYDWGSGNRWPRRFSRSRSRLC